LPDVPTSAEHALHSSSIGNGVIVPITVARQWLSDVCENYAYHISFGHIRISAQSIVKTYQICEANDSVRFGDIGLTRTS
jgi:hypothetical protein